MWLWCFWWLGVGLCFALVFGFGLWFGVCWVVVVWVFMLEMFGPGVSYVAQLLFNEPFIGFFELARYCG